MLKARNLDTFKVSVVVPMYYEEAVAEECHRRLSAALQTFDYEIIYVNDGSRDKTGELLCGICAKDQRAKVITFSRNFGHQAAVSAGVYESLGDAVVIIDADLQDPPELIADMIALWQKGYDVVYAQRAKRKGESAFKLATAKLFYKFLDAMTDINIPKDTGDFRLIDRKVADAFNAMPERNRFIRGMIPWLGFEATPISYVREERFAGQTKYPLKKMLKLAMDGIFSFSAKPVKFIELLCTVSTFAGTAMLIITIINRCVKAPSITWGFLATIVLFALAAVLGALSILGEYIYRIFDQSRQRPNYVISQRENFDNK